MDKILQIIFTYLIFAHQRRGINFPHQAKKSHCSIPYRPHQPENLTFHIFVNNGK